MHAADNGPIQRRLNFAARELSTISTRGRMHAAEQRPTQQRIKCVAAPISMTCLFINKSNLVFLLRRPVSFAVVTKSMTRMASMINVAILNRTIQRSNCAARDLCTTSARSTKAAAARNHTILPNIAVVTKIFMKT